MIAKRIDRPTAPPKLRPICLACASFDVETVIDGEPAELQVYACFDCQDVFYFMADARPRPRSLGLFEVY